MDERVTLTRTVNGQPEFRIKAADLYYLGQDGLVGEIVGRGFLASDLGTPFWRGNTMHLPIRRED